MTFTIEGDGLYFVSHNQANNTWRAPVLVDSAGAGRTLTNAGLTHEGNNIWLLAYSNSSTSALDSGVHLAHVNASTAPASVSVTDIALTGGSGNLYTLPVLAALPNGDAAVIFNTYSTSTLSASLEGRVHQSDGTLTPVFPLDDSNLGPLPNIKVVLLPTSDNQFTALWYHLDLADWDAREGLVSRRLTSANPVGLSARTFVYPEANSASNVDFAAIRMGNAVLAVWQEIEDANPDNELNLWSARLSSTWGPAQRLEREPLVASEPHLSARDDSAVVTWLAGPGGASSIYFAELCPAGNTANCD